MHLFPLGWSRCKGCEGAFQSGEVIPPCHGPSMKRQPPPDCSPRQSELDQGLGFFSPRRRKKIPLEDMPSRPQEGTLSIFPLLSRKKDGHCRFRRHTLFLERSSCPHPQPIAVRACELSVGHCPGREAQSALFPPPTPNAIPSIYLRNWKASFAIPHPSISIPSSHHADRRRQPAATSRNTTRIDKPRADIDALHSLPPRDTRPSDEVPPVPLRMAHLAT